MEDLPRLTRMEKIVAESQERQIFKKRLGWATFLEIALRLRRAGNFSDCTAAIKYIRGRESCELPDTCKIISHHIVEIDGLFRIEGHETDRWLCRLHRKAPETLFQFVWKNGVSVTIRGATPDQAFAALGHTKDDIELLDYYRQHTVWDVVK